MIAVAETQASHEVPRCLSRWLEPARQTRETPESQVAGSLFIDSSQFWFWIGDASEVQGLGSALG